MRSPTRSPLAITATLAVLVAAVATWWLAERRAVPPAAPPAPASAPVPAAADTPLAAPGAGVDGAADLAEMLADDPLAGAGDPAAAWAKVDLEAVREAMPDNLYWKMAVPTQDPAILEERKEERTRWNVEYGKVLSNTATVDEVDAYYAHQQLLSSDYLEFAVHVLTHYGDVLPQRDAALLKLAGEMHLARIEEIPRKQAEAHARREAHARARRAWRAEQEAFARGDAADAP